VPGQDEDRRVIAKLIVVGVLTVAVAVGLVMFLNRGPNLAACEAALRASYNRTLGNPSALPPPPPPPCSKITVHELAQHKTKIKGGP
jgi:hypothetical protein